MTGWVGWFRSHTIPTHEDTCTISAVTGSGTSRDTGAHTHGAAAVVYTGRCRVATSGGSSSVDLVDVNERQNTRTRVVVKLPAPAPDIIPGHRLTVTASAHNPDLTDRTFTVRDVHRPSWLIEQRLVCEELS